MKRAIQVRPSLRVRDSARAHTPAVAGARAMEPSRNEARPRIPAPGRADYPEAPARAPRRPGDGNSALTPRLVMEFPENTINIDKFTGFFDKKVKSYFIDFNEAIGFRGCFSRNFDTKKFQELCKIQAGYFSTRRFAITILWMSFVPSPTCRRMESR